MSSTRQFRFWPLLSGVYALVWGLEILLSRLQSIPVDISFDPSPTDLAIFGIVVGVWLLANTIRKQESQEDSKTK